MFFYGNLLTLTKKANRYTLFYHIVFIFLTLFQLRHTYLRVLHPLLTKTQLRDTPYKRPQILVALESLLGNSKIREVNSTTKRLVGRCLSGDWCVQLRELRESAGYGIQRVGSPSSETSGTMLSPLGHIGAASTHPDISGNKVMNSLKHSKSVEHLSVRTEPSTRQIPRSPLDQVHTRRPSNSNASIQSLPTFASPTSPKVSMATASKRRGTTIDGVQPARNNSLPHEAEPYFQRSPPLAPHTRPAPAVIAAAATHLSPHIAEGTSMQTQARRRPPPPAPTKRRKPPAIPIGRTHGGATITTIKSSEPSPLSKVYKTPIGLQQSTVS